MPAAQLSGLAVWEKASPHHEVEKLAIDLDRVAGPAARKPLAPTSGVSGAPLPKGGSFLNHGPSGRRPCRSSGNDVSPPLKSYADLLPSGRNSGHRWRVSKVPVGGHQRPAIRGTGFRNIDARADGLARCQT